MAIQLDHTIIRVNDLDESVRFYTEILGLEDAGRQTPFAIVRVSDSLQLQFAPWGTDGGEHFAFAMSPAEFDATFERVRAAAIPYGDSFHDVGNMKGPGSEPGARGPAPTLYFNDPNNHLLEIRTYAEDPG